MMLARARRHFLGCGFTLLMLLCVTACGQKGPLYLPDDEQASLTKPADNA